MLSLFVFSYVIDTNKCPFQPNDFGRTSLQGHCAWRPSSLSLASWSSFMSTTVMVSFISMAEARAWQLNESMDQLYESKENGHKLWDAAEIPNPRHEELGGGPRLCPRLHTFISNREVEAQVDFFYRVVDPKGVGEGLQSWHEAKAKWTADSWAFHCSCAELPALSTGSSACQDCHSCPLMSDPHITISPLYSTGLNSDLLPPFFSSLSQEHSLQYLFNENTFKTTYPLRKEDEVPEGVVNLIKWWDFEVYK